MTPAGGDGYAGERPQKAYVYNGGFLKQRRLRRILALAGYRVSVGLPGPDDCVAIWGNSPTAHRGRRVAARRNSGLLRVEDAFLRSLHPGRAGEPPIGLLLDRCGVHFDPSQPSDLEQMLASHPLDDTALLDRARAAMDRLKGARLTKYSGFDPTADLPAPGYVLVVDQTRNDASVRASGADRARFREMLVFAQEEHPGQPVIVKGHPETAQGFRPGYFEAGDETARVSILTERVDPWALLEGAVGVYTVSSQLGFEAILAGHKPRVFGQPFYAGWGLTTDEFPVPRRERNLTRAQLFAAAMMLYPKWYDAFRDCLCPLETVLDAVEAETRAWREDARGWTAGGMRLWKRRHVQKMFGRHQSVIFTDAPDPNAGRPHMAWASSEGAQNAAARVEDGFLRSRGLGAELVPPLSLVSDDTGIYYDPRQPSQLEHLIARRTDLTEAERARAEALIAFLTREKLSKYNLEGTLPDLPDGTRILVPGQVEDDASIRTGAGDIRTNDALLKAARAENPGAVIIYKPHPDVEAGLREGVLSDETAADVIAGDANLPELLGRVDAVWTITSLTGFEALLRGVRVTTLGAPFYAGWGLTDDRGDVPARRVARPDLAGLVHAALIDYPRYFDPVTGRPCPVEVAVERLAKGHIPHPGLANRSLSKLQGLLATYAGLWR